MIAPRKKNLTLPGTDIFVGGIVITGSMAHLRNGYEIVKMKEYITTTAGKFSRGGVNLLLFLSYRKEEKECKPSLNVRGMF